MTFSELLTASPSSPLSILFVICGILGTVLLTYGIFLEKERNQDIVFGIGALSLFVYSTSLGNAILMIAFGIFFLGNLWEYILIVSGKHKHVCYPCVKNESKQP